MRLKQGAKIEGLKPEMLFGLLILHSVFTRFGVDLVVTEFTGGQHMHDSLHYVGLAVDVRSKHIPDSETKQDILCRCKESLGSEFDIILEAEGRENEHFHIEFDIT